MFGFVKKPKTSAEDSVGPELAKVLPQDAKPWFRTKHLICLNLILLIPLCSSAGIGFDGSMMNGLQTLPQWREFFGHPSAGLLGGINAVYPICKILGLFPASWVAEKYGRKKSMLIGLIGMLFAPALQAASQNLAIFVVARSLIGTATVFVMLPSPILISELAYPTHRGKVTALANTFFYFGAIAAAWSTYATFRLHTTWAWRIPSVLQAAIPIGQLLGLYFLPESPRWLVAKGRVENARSVLSKFHAGGNEDSPLVAFEIAEIERALQADREAEVTTSWLSLFKTAAYRKRTLIAFVLGFFSQWNGIGVVTYYLTLVLDTIGITTVAEQALINGLLQIFNFAAAVFAGALLVDSFGRRRLLLVATGGLFLNAQAGYAVVAFIFIAFFFYDIAWTPLPIAYTTEIFPYSTRSKGLTVALTSTYVGLITAQLINPVALRALGWQYYIVFCCILAGHFPLIYFLFPETKGRTLEEIAEIFDGSAVTASADAVLKDADDHGAVEQVETAKGGRIRNTEV